MFDIRRYNKGDAGEWNEFLTHSKNGTFLLNRAYMDYHADRFIDFSLIIRLNSRVYALFPANRCGDTLFSHQGLSYGGLITSTDATTAGVCRLFEELNAFLREQGICRVVYKPVPPLYHRLPADEDLFALFLVCHARIIGRDVSSVIIPEKQLKWKRDRRYAANKARTNGIRVGESDDFPSFWKILSDNLWGKYRSKPVHSLNEIQLLYSRFPENISLWLAYANNGMLLAGTVLYITEQVAHSQYISASAEGKRLHAVDAIYDHIIHEAYADKQYIDLGTSNMPHSSELHESLIYQKEGFGGRAVCFDTYEYEL